MAKDDLDELDLDFELDDLDFDDGMDTDAVSKDDRTPVSRITTKATRAVKSAVKDELHLKNILEKTMPENIRKSLGILDEFSSRSSDLYNGFSQDIKPVTDQIKKTANKINQVAGGILPKKLQDKIDALTQVAEENQRREAELSRESMEASKILAEQQEIFSTQLEQNKEALDQQIASTLIGKQGTDRTNALLLSQAKMLGRLVQYQDGPGVNYQKKMLEIQYRQLFAQQNLLMQVKSDNEVIKQNLVDITKNTGLPDILKEHKGELAKNMFLRRLIDQVQDKSGFSNKLSNFIGAFFDNLQAKGKEFSSSLVSGMDTMKTAGEMIGGDGIIDAGAMTGVSAMGTHFGKAIAAKLGKNKTFAKVDKFAKGVNNGIPGVFGTLKDRLSDLQHAEENKELDTGKKGWRKNLYSVLGDLIPDVKQAGGRIGYDNGQNLLDKAEFDNATRKSIVDIIPGYLARILQSTEGIRTGSDNELMVYDHDNNRFSTKSTMRKAIDAKLFGKGNEKLDELLEKFTELLSGDSALTDDSKKAIKNRAITLARNSKGLTPDKFYQGIEGVDDDQLAILRKQLEKTFSKRELTKGLSPKDYLKTFKDDKKMGMRSSLLGLGADVAQKLPNAHYDVNQFGKAGQQYLEILNEMGLTKDGKAGTELDLDGYYQYYLNRPKTQGPLSSISAGRTVPFDRPSQSLGTAPSFDMSSVNFAELIANQTEADRINREVEILKVVDAIKHQTTIMEEGLQEILKTIPMANTLPLSESEDAGEMMGGDGVKPSRFGLGRLNPFKGRRGKSEEKQSNLKGFFNTIMDGSKLFGKGIRGTTKQLGKTMLETTKLPFKLSWGAAKGAADVVGGMFKERMDVYISGEKFPRLYKTKLAAGQYFDKATGKVITKLSDIKNDVVDEEGNIVLTLDEMTKGIFNSKGKKIDFSFLNRFGSKLKDGAGYLGSGIGSILSAYGNLPKTALDVLKKGTKVINKLKTAFVERDIYLGDEKNPRIRMMDLLMGKYRDSKGNIIKSFKDIQTDVYDTAGNLILSVKEAQEKGLFDSKGQSLKGLFGRAMDFLKTPFSMGGRFVKSGLEAVQKGFGFAANLAHGATSLLTGNPIRTGGGYQKDKWPKMIYELLVWKFGGAPTSHMTEKGEDGKVVVGRIRSFINKSFDKVFKRKSADGSIVDPETGERRKGSWRDWIANRSKKTVKEGPVEKAKESGITSFLSKIFGKGSLMMMAISSIVTLLGNVVSTIGTIGSWLMGKLGLSALFSAGFGKLGGWLKDGFKGLGTMLGKGLTKLKEPITKLAAKALSFGKGKIATLGTKVSQAASKVGAKVLGKKATAVAAQQGAKVAATKVGTKVATGLGMRLATGAARVLLGPVGWALLIAEVGYLAYKAYKWFKDKPEPFEKYRTALYGLDPDTDKELTNKLLGFEREMLSHVKLGSDKQSYVMDDVDMDRWTRFFVHEDDEGLMREDAEAYGEHSARFENWFNGRFKPAFLNNCNQAYRIDPKTSIKDTDDDLEDGLKPALAKRMYTKYDPIYQVSLLPFSNYPESDTDESQIESLMNVIVDKFSSDEQSLRKEEQAAENGERTWYGAKKEKKGYFDFEEKENQQKQSAKVHNTYTSGNTLAGSGDKVNIKDINGNVTTYAIDQVKLANGLERISDIRAIRMRTYGLYTLSTQYVNVLLSMEDEFGSSVTVNGDGSIRVDGLDFETWFKQYAVHFGLDVKSEVERANWTRWFKYRFVPVYVNYYGAGKQINKGIFFDGIEDTFKISELIPVAEAIIRLRVTIRDQSLAVWDISDEFIKGVKTNTDPGSVMSNLDNMKNKVKVGVLREEANVSSVVKQEDAINNAIQLSQSTGKSSPLGGVDGLGNNTSAGSIATSGANFSSMINFNPAGQLTVGGKRAGMPFSYGKGTEVGEGEGGNVAGMPEINNGLFGNDGKKNFELLLPSLKKASQMTGVPLDILIGIAKQESSFNPTAKARTSSASGVYQFIASTWADQVKKYGKKYGIMPGTSPFNANANILMGAEYVKENLSYLKKQGIFKDRAPNAVDGYMAHFLGAGGASTFLKAMQQNPQAYAADVMSPAAVKANQSIFFNMQNRKPVGKKTLQQVYQFMSDKTRRSAVEYFRKAGLNVDDSGEALGGNITTADEQSAMVSQMADPTTSYTGQGTGLNNERSSFVGPVGDASSSTVAPSSVSYQSDPGGVSTSPLNQAFNQSETGGFKSLPNINQPDTDLSIPDVSGVDANADSHPMAVKAADLITKAAAPKSTGYCARFVANGLEKAGYKFTRRGNAYEYANGTLAGMGFKQISPKSPPVKGDIVVWPAHGNGKKGTGATAGHIQIWNGKNWVSDFIQNNYMVSSKYNVVRPSHWRHLKDGMPTSVVAPTATGNETLENGNATMNNTSYVTPTESKTYSDPAMAQPNGKSFTETAQTVQSGIQDVVNSPQRLVEDTPPEEPYDNAISNQLAQRDYIEKQKQVLSKNQLKADQLQLETYTKLQAEGMKLTEDLLTQQLTVQKEMAKSLVNIEQKMDELLTQRVKAEPSVFPQLNQGGNSNSPNTPYDVRRDKYRQ